MKLGTVLTGGVHRAALLLDAEGGVLAPADAGDLRSFIEAGDAGIAALRTLAVQPNAERFRLADVQVASPITRHRRNILCTGWNYWDHFYESAGKREGQDVPKPDAPTFFTKSPLCVVGPTDDIAFDPAISAQWDYEAEIVVVIGKTGRSIPRDRAMEHVLGYCLANDVSQRDLQRRHGAQWFKGKSIDGASPIGPWIVFKEDIDLPSTVLECDLNGELMQHATAAEMAFGIDELVAELSWGMTLEAGDVLLTGTPSGIGNARTPPVFLRDGDEVVVRATELGQLRNRLVATDLHSYRA